MSQINKINIYIPKPHMAEYKKYKEYIEYIAKK